MENLAQYLTHSDAGAVFRALTGQAMHDPELAARLRAEHLTHQRARDRRPLERAVARGELPADTDLDAAVDRLVGPVYYRVLVTGQPVTPDFVETLVRSVVP
ncbi:TetR-like C-terminal domain-containing protein [Actinoplanes auranticolor]|uniref:TetR-like C-terminal domain-containing protein n=1 Tax=Actinoplanes auranticolor TaxID=47988 RepID=UPI0027DD08F4|nr:TetR-like C-terminal domain-containing protein [Actinoplanes auranticolor]